MKSIFLLNTLLIVSPLFGMEMEVEVEIPETKQEQTLAKVIELQRTTSAKEVFENIRNSIDQNNTCFVCNKKLPPKYDLENQTEETVKTTYVTKETHKSFFLKDTLYNFQELYKKRDTLTDEEIIAVRAHKPCSEKFHDHVRKHSLNTTPTSCCELVTYCFGGAFVCCIATAVTTFIGFEAILFLVRL